MNESPMKIPCGIARDLMSVGGDRRYPEQTQRILRRHLETCPDCARIYAEMMKPIAVAAVSPEESERFRRMAGEMKRKNPLRISLRVAALVLAALLLMGAGVFAFVQVHNMQFDVPFDQYTVELRQSGEGVPYLHAEADAAAFAGRFFYDGFEPDDSAVAGSGVYTVGCFKSLRQRLFADGASDVRTNIDTAIFLRGGKLYAFRCFAHSGSGRDVEEYTFLGEITEIRKAYGNSRGYETVWRAGDAIPVSDEFAPYKGVTEEQIDAFLPENESPSR